MDIKMLWRIATTPSCWFRYRDTSKELTEYIHSVLDRGGVPVRTSLNTCRLGDLPLWVGNFPYAYGDIADGFSDFPSRAAVFRLHDALAAADAAANSGATP